MRHEKKEGYFIAKSNNVTHNMIEYAIDGQAVDKGEDGGSKILQKLHKLANILFIVTRIFPLKGKHVGPKRCQFVVKCATDSLKLGGFIDNEASDDLRQSFYANSMIIQSNLIKKTLFLGDSIYGRMAHSYSNVTKLRAPTIKLATDIIQKSEKNQKRDIIIIGTGANNFKNDSVENINIISIISIISHLLEVLWGII